MKRALWLNLAEFLTILDALSVAQRQGSDAERWRYHRVEGQVLCAYGSAWGHKRGWQATWNRIRQLVGGI